MAQFHSLGIDPINGSYVDYWYILNIPALPILTVEIQAISKYTVGLSAELTLESSLDGVSSLTLDATRIVPLVPERVDAISSVYLDEDQTVLILGPYQAISNCYCSGLAQAADLSGMHYNIVATTTLTLSYLRNPGIEYNGVSSCENNIYLTRGGKLGIPFLHYTLEKLRYPTGRIIILQDAEL